MKGLFLNSYYTALGNIKLFLLLVAAAGTALLVTGNPTAQELFVYITITVLPINSVASMRKDAVSKWNKYELTMPLRRIEIIRCKYLSFLFWVLLGTAVAAAVTIVSVLIHNNLDLFYYGIRDIFSMFVLGIGIAMLTGALFYLLAYLFGVEKSETILIISVIGAIGTAVVIINMLHKSELSFYTNILAFAAIYIVLFIASYFAAAALYSRKEY